MSLLDQMVAAARERVGRAQREKPIAELERALAESRADRPFSEALVRPGVSLVAEFKRRSPSAGEIRPGATVEEMVRAYERGGAAALSVLTEAEHFGGSLDDLRVAVSSSSLPVLRKDFIVDVYQLYEAAAAGADAVLLIVAALGENDLRRLYGEARGLDLDCLVEVHTADELERALELDADVLGINNRNLEDFSVDLDRTFELITDVPAGKTVVSESGILYREQLEELERVGVDAVLVGEALMRAPDPQAACRRFASEDGEEPA